MFGSLRQEFVSGETRSRQEATTMLMGLGYELQLIERGLKAYEKVKGFERVNPLKGGYNVQIVAELICRLESQNGANTANAAKPTVVQKRKRTIDTVLEEYVSESEDANNDNTQSSQMPSGRPAKRGRFGFSSNTMTLSDVKGRELEQQRQIEEKLKLALTNESSSSFPDFQTISNAASLTVTVSNMVNSLCKNDALSMKQLDELKAIKMREIKMIEEAQRKLAEYSAVSDGTKSDDAEESEDLSLTKNREIFTIHDYNF